MSLKAVFHIFAFGIILLQFSCNNHTSAGGIDISSGESDTVLSNSTFLATCLEKSIDLDSADWSEINPLKIFESGYFLIDSVKHAYYVQENEDEIPSCDLLLYQQSASDGWVMIDSQVRLPFNTFSFRLVFLDFNFDGVNDIFMQSTCSNGYTICRGLLFEFDPIAKKMILHPEVNDFGNFSVDKDKRILIAEELEDCPPFKQTPVQIYFEFADGLLNEVKRVHHCENPHFN